ncbi:hypothetical protein N7444_010798 [Penicillium canescens]|nr:hypothetical protein N7444_010798 [Penicillium canescens]
MVFFPKGIFLFLILIAAIQRTGLADTASSSVTASIQLDELAQFALYMSKKTLALPSRTPSYQGPGAKTRYDDFVATHLNQTLFIHRTGTFLGWHRFFIHEFEQALRDDCGCAGDYPYWDWGADADAMEKSPVFDGSDTSLSGNGASIPNQLDIKVPLGNYTPTVLPPGTGGGCVTSGPFASYTVNMGPSFLSLPGVRPQGMPGSRSLGVHGVGHYAMGGDPGRDADNSPGDPGFWLHHGMIDRVWWIWQGLDLETRQYAISGTSTFLDQPASPNVTLETVIDIGHANGGPIAMGELMSTTMGPFCYVYV